MLNNNPSRRTRVACGILSMIALFAAWMLFLGGPDSPEWSAASRAALRKAAGGPQLVSIEPLPALDGQLCQWTPASANTTLAAVLQQERRATSPPPAPSADGKTSIEVDREPARVIRDTYPTYSAIAVDTNSHEVYLQDENLFGYKVFNRLDNTPPTAAFTEPKRMVGGINTKMEFNCGLYVDPKNGDVYSVANDTIDTLVIFPRNAEGNVAPQRELRTPHGTYGIAVDEGAQELFLTVEHINAVVVYRKMAEGEEKSLRAIQGDQTGLEDPHGIALDTKNNWLFVSNHGNVKDIKPPRQGRFEMPSITVYPLKASGDTPPIRIIEGPQTQLNWPAQVFVDEEHGELYVANDSGDSILVFRVTDDGDVAPSRVVKGPRTGIKNPTGIFVDLQNDELWVSNMGNHSATVFQRTANGNVAPLRTIRSAPQGKLALAIGNPGAVEYDSKRDEILVPN